MEEGTYSSTAMVIRDKCILVDRELQEHTPDIRELIHYLVKGERKMPKILWKNILDSSRRELVLAIVMIPLFWFGITEGSFGGLNQVMYIYNLMISIFPFSAVIIEAHSNCHSICIWLRIQENKDSIIYKNVQIQIPCVVYSAAFTYINHGNNQP